MSGPGSDTPKRRAKEEAAVWFARIRTNPAEEQSEEFKAWFEEPLHRWAYNDLQESFSLGTLYDGQWKRARPRWRVPAGVAALLVLVTGTWLTVRWTGLDQGPNIAQHDSDVATGTALLATATGETRAIRLRDGSLLTLASATKVSATFSGALRRLTLERGTARFQVAHEARPFVVFAGGGSVTARGTIFDVALAEDRRVSVRLIQGVVDVTLPSPRGAQTGTPPAHRLHSGETISYAAQVVAASQPPALGPQAASASSPVFEGGATDYDGIKVADLITAANRGSSRPIHVADPTVGQRRVSGRFRIDDTGLLAERIAILFDLVVDRSDARAIVLRRR